MANDSACRAPEDLSGPLHALRERLRGAFGLGSGFVGCSASSQLSVNAAQRSGCSNAGRGWGSTGPGAAGLLVGASGIAGTAGLRGMRD
jgi:hypothetical protein